MGFAVNGTQRLLVYEYLSGGDVSRRLQKCARDNSPFTFSQRLSVALDAACGLSHLHNANPKVFHRDIKTANILLDRNGGAKMADFGLACLSRSSEHKVKQASGTIGYACPYYIQRGVVTEGSEVYSFGMVLIELLCNAPPACSGPNPGEILYLVNHLQGSVSRCSGMADPKAGWPAAVATKLAELAMSCVSMNEQQRPKFVQIVKQLRNIIELSSSVSESQAVPANKPATVVPAQASIPPAAVVVKKGVDLIKLEHSNREPGKPPVSILHSCSVEEAGGSTLPAFKVGRHVQSGVFDSLVPTDNLKGTISREHFVISFQPVTRSAERLFHATVTNNSINSISVNEKILEKGQSSFIYTGDTIAFLALQQNAQSPTPFLTFRVEILNPVIQSIRPQPQANSTSAKPASSSSSLPMGPGSVNVSVMNEDSLILNTAAQAGNFWLQLKGSSVASEESSLLSNDIGSMIRVGRSFQPEAFWRAIAPEACPAISREHFSISAVNEKNGYRFMLTCNSLNGLTVASTSPPVFLQKDNSPFEIHDGAEIELASGAIRFVFRETMNPSHGVGGVSTVGSTSAGTRSINYVPAAVLRPPVNFGGKTTTASASGSFIASADEDEDPDDAFSKTGFRRSQAA
jgi:serine/threonine protein kinase